MLFDGAALFCAIVMKVLLTSGAEVFSSGCVTVNAESPVQAGLNRKVLGPPIAALGL